jgi:hypothetical protein
MVVTSRAGRRDSAEIETKPHPAPERGFRQLSLTEAADGFVMPLTCSGWPAMYEARDLTGGLDRIGTPYLPIAFFKGARIRARE